MPFRVQNANGHHWYAAATGRQPVDIQMFFLFSFQCPNTDGSFTTAGSNSFLGPLEQIL